MKYIKPKILEMHENMIWKSAIIHFWFYKVWGSQQFNMAIYNLNNRIISVCGYKCIVYGINGVFLYYIIIYN